jgi:hypothetical protein
MLLKIGKQDDIRQHGIEILPLGIGKKRDERHILSR